MQPANFGDSIGADAKQRHQISARRARERELERRRAQGEISCAECRRLKLKCNKKVPCNSCIRRGCHTICPNGLLTTGQGSRFVLANTDKLHSKLLQMSQRIRQLEDALQISHSSTCKAPHPLLSDDLLAIKSGMDDLTKVVGEKEEAIDEEEELVSALGTLAVAECGATRFVGRVAAETLLMDESAFDTTEPMYTHVDPITDVEQQLPESILHAAKGFPLVHAQLPRHELFEDLWKYLPSYERATALVEALLENVAFLPRPIQRDQFMEELLPMIYKGKHSEPSNPQSCDDGKFDGKPRMHSLALAFAAFACGAAGDLTLPANNSEGKLYYILALAALNTHPVTSPGGASLETVQAMVLIAQYDFFSGEKTTLEGAWKIVSFGLVVAASIGLHRDPAHWNLGPKLIQRRRAVFWELLCLDKFKSLGTGRPSVFHLQEVDCRFPDDNDTFVDEGGKEKEGVNRWRYRFAKQIVGPISEHLCLTRPIKYSEIMDFDRRIREFDDAPIPVYLANPEPSDKWKARLWSLQKELTLLTIHRNFFARAMIRDSENPLRSPFAPSFLCAYASSIKLLRSVRVCYELNPGNLLRLWPLWTHCLTSGVIIGSVASNVNQPALASAAFHDLDLAVKLFEVASVHSVARRGLPILRRLQERALSAIQNKVKEGGPPTGTAGPNVENDESEELNILRGSARLVHRKTKARANTGSSGSPTHLSSSDGNSTPRSSVSSNVPSDSPMMGSVSMAPAANQQVTGDGMLFAPEGTGAHRNANAGTLPTGSIQLPFQSTCVSLDQDIVSLLNTIYGSPDSGSKPSNMITPGPELPGQQPQQLPQALYSFNSNTPYAMPNNAWVPEPVFPGSYGNVPPPFETAPTGTTAAPSYDMTWITGNGPTAPTGFSGGAAQFLEDWRLQAAIEGAGFLPDPDVDQSMGS